MNKIFLGAVFGLTIMGSAGASIISRGFFDEQIGNYATLDLLNSKANQKDLTALSDRIGVRNWSVDNVHLLIDSFPFTKELFPDLYGGGDSWVLEDVMPMSYYFELNNANSSWPGLAGVTDKFLHGWTNSDRLTRQGLIALNDGWTDKNDGTTYLGLKDINTKIGNLPSGNFPGFPGYEYVLQPLTYPTSLEELITALYGNSETGAQGLLATIINGFPLNGNPDEYVGLIQNFLLARDAFLGASANTAKIGTLPAGYDSVGAALTAIEGIAEEAKTLAEKAIPDPRAEGGNGKFVLTVDVIGDNATYHWEKIDRTLDETQTVSE